MALIKLGETVQITSADIQDTDAVLSELDTTILEEFTKTAASLKEIAPKANDFLYFTAIMMHAAEASLLDEAGDFRKNADGSAVSASWEKVGKDSVKWVCSDKAILPYRNSNRDIFPESELKLAYKKWVGKPLCLDHQSQSVDHIRGVIVDTYYDEKHKRIIALCALDKVNYPDLARKVATGYATCVSMGTAVSKAICTEDGCHKTAMLEPDFCDHMRSRTAYGEINTGLSPIELSIVVNGADPKAKIRHVVAAANSIAQYLENKKELLNATNDATSLSEIRNIEETLAQAQEAIGRLKVLAEKDGDSEDKDEQDVNDAEDIAPPYGQHGSLSQGEVRVNNTDSSLNFPQRFAGLLDNLETRISSMIDKVASLEANNKIIEDTQMSKDLEKKSYFQGGGGVNEPTPGKVKYPKEEADKIRDTQDKQMTGESPFPNTGPVDGMFPGDKEVKELHSRAAEERRIRRQAAVEAAQKYAYFQGGGGVNEPTPGKVKYPKEEADKIRDTEDKQMVGAPPFPGVGSVDGLYGDDLKKKQMLSRAKLSAKFVKAANVDGTDNLRDSRWDVYADNKVILSASVKDIAGDKAEALFTSIATKDFASQVLKTIRSQGFDAAVKLYKGAQAVDPTALPAAPVDTAVPAAFPEVTPEVPEVTDSGANGEPVAQIRNLVDQVDNNVADLKKALEALEDEDTTDLAALETADLGTTASLSTMRKTLNSALVKGVKQALAELEDNREELELLQHIYSSNKSLSTENKKQVESIRASALSDVKTTTANVHKLMSAFVKYARGTENLVKRAQAVDFGFGVEKEEDKDLDKLVNEWKAADEAAEKVDADAKFGEIEGVFNADDKDKPEGDKAGREEGGLVITPSKHDKTPEEVKKMLKDLLPPEADELDRLDADVKVDLEKKELTTDPATAKEIFNTAAARQELRAKLAKESVTFSDMLDKAHPQGGATTALNVKPTLKDGDKVEDLEEVHTKMLEVANKAPTAGKAPVAVRKAAQEIQRLVTAGRIDPATDFPGLIAEGLDAAAVSYWKSFWGEAKDGGSEFAAELVKDYAKKKASEELEVQKVKLARAYELTQEMAEKGLCETTKEARNEQVDAIMKWSDEQFDSFKKVVGRKTVVKTAMPLVGSDPYGFTQNTVAPLPAVKADNSLQSELDAIFSAPKTRR